MPELQPMGWDARLCQGKSLGVSDLSVSSKVQIWQCGFAQVQRFKRDGAAAFAVGLRLLQLVWSNLTSGSACHFVSLLPPSAHSSSCVDHGVYICHDFGARYPGSHTSARLSIWPCPVDLPTPVLGALDIGFLLDRHSSR